MAGGGVRRGGLDQCAVTRHDGPARDRNERPLRHRAARPSGAVLLRAAPRLRAWARAARVGVLGSVRCGPRPSARRYASQCVVPGARVVPGALYVECQCAVRASFGAVRAGRLRRAACRAQGCLGLLPPGSSAVALVLSVGAPPPPLPLWRGPQELWCGAFHSVTGLTRGVVYGWMNVWPGGEGR